MSYYLRTLPLVLKAEPDQPDLSQGQDAQRLFADGDITCLYIVGTDVSSDMELPIELHYNQQDVSFIVRRKAYKYAASKNEQSVIYTLPALLPNSAIPYEHKGLVNEQDSTLNFTVHVPSSNGTTENLGLATLCIEEPQQSTTVLESWLAFFDFLLLENKTIDFDNKLIVRFKNLNELIEQFCQSDKRAPRSIILKIAERANDILPILGRKLRKNLHNTRTLLPVERINALDGKCLEYLLKIEGRSIREKAQKNKLKLMGLTKYESYNLLENRVLKDFLHRCTVKATSYLQDFEEYTRASRGANDQDVKAIRSFKNRCNDLSTNTDLADVPRQLSLPKPNFVLLKDPYYKQIWELYLDLIHEKNDIDQTLACQQNLFHDICDLLLNTALCHLCEQPDMTKANHNYLIRTITKSYVKLNSNIMAGHRIKLGCNAGPFLVFRTPEASCVIEVITNGSDNIDMPQHVMHILSAHRLLATAPSYLLFTRASASHSSVAQQKRLIVPIFTVHANAQSDRDLELFKEHLAKLSVYTAPVNKVVHPCFVLSTTMEHAVGQSLDHQDNFTMVLVQQHPRNWLQSRDAFESFLSALIERFLGQ